MQLIRALAIMLMPLLMSCAGDRREAIVGKWKRADNREVIEFAEDGTLTRLSTIQNQKVTSGGSYTFPNEDKIQLVGQFGGPATFGYEMLGDSMYLTHLDGKRTKYYRDRGDRPSINYVLRTVNGQAVPNTIPLPGLDRRATYTEGSLTLDLLTHTFELKHTVGLSGALGGPTPRIFTGTYIQKGDSLSLHPDTPPDSPPLPGSIQGETLTHETYISTVAPRDGQKYIPGPVLGYVRQ